MTTQNKLVDLKPEDWLRLYVDAELKAFSKKFEGTFDEAEVDSVCKMVSDRKLPEGVDVFYALRLLIDTEYYPMTKEEKDNEMDIDLATSVAHGCKLGQDRLIYMYSKYCELEGYDDRVAHIFKQSLNYCIPF